MVGLARYSSLSQFSEDLPTYEEQMTERTENVDAWLQDHGIDASGTLGLDGFTGHALSDVASRLISAILDFLSSFFLLLMLTAFFLIDAGLFVAKGQRQVAAVQGRWPAVVAFVRDLLRFFVITSVVPLILTMSPQTSWLGDWLAVESPESQPPVAEHESATVQVVPGS